MRYEFNDYERGVIRPMLPNKPRGIPRGMIAVPSMPSSRLRGPRILETPAQRLAVIEGWAACCSNRPAFLSAPVGSATAWS